MWLLLLAFIIILGILGSLSYIKKQEKGEVNSLKASDFEIIEVKDPNY